MLLYLRQTSQCSVSKHKCQREHVLIKQIDRNTQFPAFSLITVQNVPVSACERNACLFHQIYQLFIHYSYALHCKGEWTAHIHKSKMSKGQKRTERNVAIYHKKTTKGCLRWVFTGHQITNLHQKENKLCRTKNIRRTHWKLETGLYWKLFSFKTLQIKL